MVNSISEFQGRLFEYNLAKPYNFEIVIRPFIGIPSAGRALSFQAQSASLPGRSIVSNDIRTYGPIRQQPYMTTYNPFSVTFRVSEDLKERKYFDTWMNMVEDPATHDMGWYDEYTSDIIVHQINPSIDKYCRSYVLQHAFPTEVQEMRISHEPTNAVLMMNVVFRYHQWNLIDDNDSMV